MKRKHKPPTVDEELSKLEFSVECGAESLEKKRTDGVLDAVFYDLRMRCKLLREALDRVATQIGIER